MKNTSRLLAAGILTGVISFASVAHAEPLLYEGCLSVDGEISSASSAVPEQSIECSVATGGAVAGLGADGLGIIEVIISTEGSHSVGLFVDHEIDQAINTFFNEYGAAVGTPEAGQSWEIDEPGYLFGDIYDNFQAGTLDNFNNVPAGLEDDVSMSLFWDFVLSAGETATISFLIGDTAPGGFYLEHTDPNSQESIFFSSSLTIEGDEPPPPPPPTPVPEPGTLLLLGAGLLGIGATRRRRLINR